MSTRRWHPPKPLLQEGVDREKVELSPSLDRRPRVYKFGWQTGRRNQPLFALIHFNPLLTLWLYGTISLIMSSQHLATELLQHIVEKLGEDNETKEGLQTLLACSTTHSALLDVSQKHIFRSVTLYDRVPELPGGTPLDSDARCDRTQLLLRTFREHPRFVPLVHNLSYYFSPGCSSRPGALLDPLRQFPNVESLLVGFYASPIDRGVVARTFGE